MINQPPHSNDKAMCPSKSTIKTSVPQRHQLFKNVDRGSGRLGPHSGLGCEILFRGCPAWNTCCYDRCTIIQGIEKYAAVSENENTHHNDERRIRNSKWQSTATRRLEAAEALVCAPLRGPAGWSRAPAHKGRLGQRGPLPSGREGTHWMTDPSRA